MGVGEKILMVIFLVGFAVFFFSAGIALLWMGIEDTALGRVIDEIMEEWIERRRG